MIISYTFVYYPYSRMFILSNGDVCEDEEIYGESIYDYPEDMYDLEMDEDLYTGQDDEMLEDVICRWEMMMI